MNWYRDLVSPPGLLSLVRVPLAAAFPFAVHEPFAALSILVVAALTDVLDGWYARTFGRTTPTGAILDPIMDKLFVATVTLTLVVGGKLLLTAALLLGARDIAELPLVIWFAVDPRARVARAASAKANVFGKIVTVFQFATVTAALLANRHTDTLALATGILGALAAFTYWARALGHVRSTAAGPRGQRTPPGSVSLERPAEKRT